MRSGRRQNLVGKQGQVCDRFYKQEEGPWSRCVDGSVASLGTEVQEWYVLTLMLDSVNAKHKHEINSSLTYPKWSVCFHKVPTHHKLPRRWEWYLSRASGGEGGHFRTVHVHLDGFPVDPHRYVVPFVVCKILSSNPENIIIINPRKAGDRESLHTCQPWNLRNRDKLVKNPQK